MRKWFLVGILVLAFLLRVVGLGKYPSGFTPDEASFGYDAYSILTTGRDQWGQGFPLVLESFGDYKSPLQAYLIVPFVGILGLSKVGVRLPNALLGTLAVFVCYLLVIEIETRIHKKANKDFALLAAFLFAVSPWHVMLSRGAFEANLTTFFLPLGIYLFLRGLVKPGFLVLSALVLGLNLFSYHSAKLVTPVLLIMSLIVFGRDIKKRAVSGLIIPGLVFLLFIGLTAYTLTIGGLARAQDVSIFRGALEGAAKTRIELIAQGQNPILARLLHNKYQFALNRFWQNYQQYFSFRFLFLRGPAEATYGMLPGRGVLYWFELPFVIGFLIFLYRNRAEKKYWLLVFWILVAPIPAALSTGVGYAANRAVIMLPALPIVLAYGALELFGLAKSKIKNLAKVLTIGYLGFSSVFIFVFVKDYFISPPVILAKQMLSGNLEAMQWLAKNKGEHQVVVSRGMSEPQIYVAFAEKWNPEDYQLATKNWDYQNQGLNWLDQLSEYNLGQYTFRQLDWGKEKEINTWFVGRATDFAKDVKRIQTIYYPDGTEAVLIVEK